MSQQEEIIVRELDKNPNIRITDLEGMTGLPIGEVCKIRYFWKREGIYHLSSHWKNQRYLTEVQTTPTTVQCRVGVRIEDKAGSIRLCLFVSDFIDYHL